MRRRVKRAGGASAVPPGLSRLDIPALQEIRFAGANTPLSLLTASRREAAALSPFPQNPFPLNWPFKRIFPLTF